MSGTTARKLKDLLKERDEVKKQVEDSKEKTAFAETKVADKEKHIARIVAEAKEDLDVLKRELAGAILHQRQMQSRLEDLENMDYVSGEVLGQALPVTPATSIADVVTQVNGEIVQDNPSELGPGTLQDIALSAEMFRRPTLSETPSVFRRNMEIDDEDGSEPEPEPSRSSKRHKKSSGKAANPVRLSSANNPGRTANSRSTPRVAAATSVSRDYTRDSTEDSVISIPHIIPRLQRHPVLFTNIGQAYELRCQIDNCNTNAKMVQGKAQFFDGHKGFQQHVVKFHKVAKFEPLKHCRYKELTEDEAEQRSREYTRGITDIVPLLVEREGSISEMPTRSQGRTTRQGLSQHG